MSDIVAQFADASGMTYTPDPHYDKWEKVIGDITLRLMNSCHGYQIILERGDSGINFGFVDSYTQLIALHQFLLACERAP